MMSFGAKLEGYRNLSWSTLTLLRSLLCVVGPRCIPPIFHSVALTHVHTVTAQPPPACRGEFELEEMADDNLVMGPLFFVLFTAVAVLVILNTLIAIVSDA